MRKTEYPPALRDLVAQLRQMPGVGPRSAERIALWIVQARGDQPEQIARAISETRRGIHPCKLCGYFTTNELCDICSDSSRALSFVRRTHLAVGPYRSGRFADQRAARAGRERKI